MQDKTALKISDDLRQYIEAIVEEVVLEGKHFENHKKYLPRFCEEEGVNYSSLEKNLSDFLEIVEEWKTSHDKENAMMVKRLGRQFYLSDAFVDNLLMNIEKTEQKQMKEEEQKTGEAEDPPSVPRTKGKKGYKPKKRIRKTNKDIFAADKLSKDQLKEKKFSATVKFLLITLGVISLAEIITMGWCSVIPLFINVFIGGRAFEMMEGENLTPGFLLRGGVLVVMVFFLTYYLHWWSLLLTPLLSSLVLTKNDIDE